MATEHVDVVVIGSGFGGSVSAYRLAEAGLRVVLLERGRAYPPGSFPRTQHEMSRSFWNPGDDRFGMFNVWSFAGIEALVSAGLGGGSLIYANVLLRKPPEWFVDPEDYAGAEERWPIRYEDLEPHYDRVEPMLGAQRFPFDVAPYSAARKTRALKEAAEKLGLDWILPNLAVTFGNEGETPVPGEPIREAFPNLHGRTRTTCHLCGECDIGCNTGSKNTLDYNYLSAAQRAGAEIRTLSEVRTFEPRAGGGFTVRYVRHEPGEGGRPSREHPVELTADRLVVSAGTLGSTFLLLKNRAAFPNLSDRLGDRFCGNGDLLSFAMKCTEEDDSGRRARDLGPTYGPVITSTVRVPDTQNGGDGRGFYIQDAGFPAFVTWLVEATNVGGTARRMTRLIGRRIRARLSRDPRSDITAEVAAALGACDLSTSSLPLLGMGRDVPDGRLYLDTDDHLACTWTLDSSKPFFERVRSTMADLAEAWGGTFLPNPTYRISRVITVHPLGGCPMGSSPEYGVVDPYGEVYGHPGLYVADGSVMPGPTGPNPALTIAALADRTADRILSHAL